MLLKPMTHPWWWSEAKTTEDVPDESGAFPVMFGSLQSPAFTQIMSMLDIRHSFGEA